MINDVFKTQSGLMSTCKFKIRQLKRLSYFIDQSLHQDVTNVFTGSVNSLDIDKKSSRYLLSGCSDGSIYIHDLFNFTGVPEYTAKCINSAGIVDNGAHKSSIETVSWFANDREIFLTSGLDQIVRMWDAAAMKPVDHFLFKGRIYHHDCTSTQSVNPILAVATAYKEVELLDVRCGTSVIDLKGHTSSVLACKWSPLDEHFLATGGIEGKILYWDVRKTDRYLISLDESNGKRKGYGNLAHAGIVNGLEFTSDGLFLLSTGTDNQVRLWNTHHGKNLDINYGKVRNDVRRHLGYSICNTQCPLAFVPSGGYIYLLEIFTGRTKRILNGHFNIVNCTYYRELFMELYTAGKDQNVLTWTIDCRLPPRMNELCKTKVESSLPEEEEGEEEEVYRTEDFEIREFREEYGEEQEEEEEGGEEEQDPSINSSSSGTSATE